MPRVTKKVAAAKLREAAKKLKRQATAALLTPTPLVTTEPKPELKYDGEAEWPIAGGSSLPLEPTIEIDVKPEPVYTAGETQEALEWEVELKEELVDVENPADLDAEQDPIGGQGGGRLLTPQAKEEKEEDFRCQFCLKLFQESGGRGIITKAKIEFALGLRKWGGPRPNCCEGCRRMFDLFYEFKQSCLMALAQPAELFIWSFNKGPAQFVDLKSNRKKPKSKGWKPVKIDDCKKLNSLKVEVFQGIGTSAKLEGLDPGAVIVEALPAGLQQDVQVAEPVVEPETVTIVALSSGLQQQDDKEAVCVICHETFPDGLSLRHHLTKHYPPEPKKKRVRIRKAPVNKEKKKYCGHCRKWFSDKELYAQHKADCIETFKRNKPPPPEFACSLCPRKFHRQLDLTYHNNMHNDVRTIPCRREGCTKMFYNPNVRHNHEKLCGQDVQVICSMCGSIFRSKSALRIHMSTHGDPQFMCDICNKGFYTKANLKKHASAHSDERRFQCKTCGKRFKSHEANRVHQRIHTEEKPYICHICGQRFTYNCLLKTHLEKGHESLPMGLPAPPNVDVLLPNPFAGLGF